LTTFLGKRDRPVSNWTSSQSGSSPPVNSCGARRSLQYFLPSYGVILREFRNGPQLIWAHYNRRPADVAVLRDGWQIHNAAHRLGFVDTLIEIWGLREYTCEGFYAPRNGDTVMDLGANIGLFSIWVARQAPEATVLAFEPFPQNCQALRSNILGWRHNIRVCNSAVGGKAGAGRMLDVGQRSLDHRLVTEDTAGGDMVNVEVITLESAINMTGASMIDLLKMDIEGAELEVLEASSPKALRRIRRISLEYHDNIRTGTLRRVTDLISATHRIVDVRGETYGILRAELR
jgi:FkbM family methyltransferase